MTRRAQLLRLLPALVLGGALGGLFVAFWPKAPAPPLPPRAVSLQIPQEQELLDFTVSSDGTKIVYAAIVDGQTNLYLRRLHTFDAQMVPATIGATQPFFSPDGTAVAFFADGWLQTATLNGEGHGSVQYRAVPREARGGKMVCSSSRGQERQASNKSRPREERQQYSQLSTQRTVKRHTGGHRWSMNNFCFLPLVSMAGTQG